MFDGTQVTTEPCPKDGDIISANWHSLEDIKALPLRSHLVLKCIEDSLNRPIQDVDFIYEDN
jgi:phosphatase NudJ